MNKRSLILKASGAAAILAALVLWAAQRADAIIVVDGKPAVHTATFGLSAFDIARVYTANISSGIHPCVVEVQFIGPRGEVLDRVGQKVLPGETAFVDYADRTLRPPLRTHLRVKVVQAVPPVDDDQPTPACAMTTEVFDGRSGQTLFIIDDGDRAR